jgi:hypothetical protein
MWFFFQCALYWFQTYKDGAWRINPYIHVKYRGDPRCYVLPGDDPADPSILYNHLGPIFDFRVWARFLPALGKNFRSSLT